MKEWTIWDFPSNLEIQLKDNIRTEFFTTMYNIFGSQKAFAKFVHKERTAIQGYQYNRGWDLGQKHEKYIPLEILQKSLPLINNTLKQKLEMNITSIRCHGGKSISPILPIQESPELYRVIAHIIADGNDSHTPYYANTSKELRESFKNDIQIFGEVICIDSKTNTTPIVSFPKVITRISEKIFDIKFTHPTHLPEHIFDTSDDCKAAFLQALYDDEGTISTRLAINMNNINIIKEIKILLDHFNIQTGKITESRYISKQGEKTMYSISINVESYQRFNKLISFLHPEKIKCLNAAMQTKNRLQRTRPIIQIEKEIIRVLINNSTTTIEIANTIQLTLNGTRFHLLRMQEEGKITRTGYKNKAIWNLTDVPNVSQNM